MNYYKFFPQDLFLTENKCLRVRLSFTVFVVNFLLFFLPTAIEDYFQLWIDTDSGAEVLKAAGCCAN